MLLLAWLFCPDSKHLEVDCFHLPLLQVVAALLSCGQSAGVELLCLDPGVLRKEEEDGTELSKAVLVLWEFGESQTM